MVITLFHRSHEFVVEHMGPLDVCRILPLAFRAAEETGQIVHILAFEVHGREARGQPLEGPPGLSVFLGSVDTGPPKWLGVGNDIVLWASPSEEWAFGLISERWRDSHICWGVIVDQGGSEEVAEDMRQMWPRAYGKGDLFQLVRSVGPARRFAMVSFDGSWFSGKVSEDCWETVREALEAMQAGGVKVYVDGNDDD